MRTEEVKKAGTRVEQENIEENELKEETQEAEERALKAMEADVTVQTTVETEYLAEREVKMENMEAYLMVKVQKVQKEGT